jgi:hypothetical protein
MRFDFEVAPQIPGAPTNLRRVPDPPATRN